MSLFSKTLGLDAYSSPYRKQQGQALTNIGGLATPYQTQATQGATTASQFLPQRNSAGQGILDMLKGGFDGAGTLKAKTLQGVGTGFDGMAARARLRASRTGTDPTAALSLLDARRSTDTNNALTNYEEQKRQKDLEYKQMALQVASGLGGAGLSEQNAALGNLEGVYGTQMQGYGNLATQDEQARAAQQQRLMQMLQAGAGIAGSFQRAPGRIQPQSLPDSPNLGGAEFMPYNGMEAPPPDYSAVLRMFPQLAPSVRSAAPRRNTL